jgi:hypothetical protein
VDQESTSEKTPSPSGEPLEEYLSRQRMMSRQYLEASKGIPRSLRRLKLHAKPGTRKYRKTKAKMKRIEGRYMS